MTGRRTVVLLGLLGAGLIMLGVSRPWGSVRVASLASFGDIDITGGTAAPAGAAVAIAVAAASLVLTIAGRVVRFLIPFGVLVAGVALAVSGVGTLNDPDQAAADALRDTLSLGGDLAGGFDLEVSTNAWGWIYVVGAVVIALAGLLGVLGSRAWAVSGRRFEREGAATGSGPGEGVRSGAGVRGARGGTTADASGAAVGGWSSSADVWDAQNRGEDLTTDEEPADEGGTKD
ncbi:hypothetical protein JCM9957A_71600 [Kineosporia succinea]